MVQRKKKRIKYILSIKNKYLSERKKHCKMRKRYMVLMRKGVIYVETVLLKKGISNVQLSPAANYQLDLNDHFLDNLKEKGQKLGELINITDNDINISLKELRKECWK